MSELCHACGGRQGECASCGSPYYCVRAVACRDGTERDFCTECLGQYHTHKFTVNGQDEERSHG